MTTPTIDILPRRTLLLVEDNPGDAELVTDFLEASPAGWSDRVILVPSLAAATARLDAVVVDAVLLDIHLPDGHGVACVEAVRHHAPLVPIVVLTGLDDEDMALSCISAGAQDYLSKQEIRAQNLRRAIGYAIARAREAAERRRADALQARLASIVENSADAILSTTLDGVVSSWNRGAEHIFECSAEEAIGRTFADLLPTVDAPWLAKSAPPSPWSAAPGDHPDAAETVKLRRDGTEVALSVVSSRIYDEVRNEIGIALICRDITRQKVLETQLLMSDRLASLGSLAAGVAHEINNPLAAVIANIDLAEHQVADMHERLPTDPTIPEELREELRDVREAARQIRQVVGDLRIFSRGESGTRGVHDIHTILESVARMARAIVRHRARFVRDYGEVATVLVNDSRLTQVFLNLVVNAAQAIPDGDPEHNEIRVVTQMLADGRVSVEIRDTGAGMSAETQRRLFTPYFSTKAPGTGTGLGLVICRRIVAEEGGEISFETDTGRGTSFRVLLPAAAEAAGARVPPTPPPALPRAARRGRIMVIDDERMILTSVRRMLGKEHEVSGFESAGPALERLRSGAVYDVILCDLMMPGISGMEFRRLLGELDSALLPRLVFMSGGAFTPDIRTFADAAGAALVDKPFDNATLRSVVNRLLK